MMWRLWGSAAVLCLLGCAGCSTWQSALYPAGPQALHLRSLFYLFTAICGAVWLIVMLVLAGALLRGRANPPSLGVDRRATAFVGVGIGSTVVIIAVLTVLSYFATHALYSGLSDPLRIEVRGYQWWWGVRYEDGSPSENFVTANEIHVPIGQPIRISLVAEDVIHSFWAPNLDGKEDLIPGRDNDLTFVVDRPGIYRQQCAEFCGLQHAHMAMIIVAEPADAFAAWRRAQLSSAASPADGDQVDGQKIFVAKACSACHTIRGTAAAGTTGPDLTHVGSRQYIAAGLLPTTRGSIAAWVADPQTIKPGNNMPMVSLTSNELNAVSAYLAALK
jgi:cytochrome c oxidase subunit 2